MSDEPIVSEDARIDTAVIAMTKRRESILKYPQMWGEMDAQEGIYDTLIEFTVFLLTGKQVPSRSNLKYRAWWAFCRKHDLGPAGSIAFQPGMTQARHTELLGEWGDIVLRGAGLDPEALKKS